MYHVPQIAERYAAARRHDLLADAESARRANQAGADRAIPVLARAAARWGGSVRVLRGGAPSPAPSAA